MPTVLSDEGRQPTKRVRIMAEIRINLVDDKKLHSKKKRKKKKFEAKHTERWPASSTQAGRPLCSRVTFRPSAVYVSAASLLPFLLHSQSIFLCLFPSLNLFSLCCPFSCVQFSFCFHFALQKLLLLCSASTSSCESRLSDLAHHIHRHRYTTISAAVPSEIDAVLLCDSNWKTEPERL